MWVQVYSGAMLLVQRTISHAETPAHVLSVIAELDGERLVALAYQAIDALVFEERGRGGVSTDKASSDILTGVKRHTASR